MSMKLDFFYFLFEIKFRILYLILSILLTLSCCYSFSETWLFFYSKPFLLIDDLLEKKLILNKLTEGIDIVIRVTFFTSIFFLIPSLTYNFWAFLIPSLTLSERKKLNTLLLFFLCLFYLCFLLFYLVIFPLILTFLTGFEIKSPFFELIIEPTFSSYLKVSIVLLGFFYFFIYSILFLFICVSQGWIKSSDLRVSRKILLFIIILISSVISPPDLITQFNLSLFFYSLYEFIFFFGIFMAVYNKKKLG